MKFSKKKIFFLLILLLGVLHVNAASFEMECPTKVNSGQTITIPVYVNAAGSNISAIEGLFSYEPSQLQLSGYNSILTGWTTLSNDNRFSFKDISFNNLITTDRFLAFNASFNVANNVSSDINLDIINPAMTDEQANDISEVSGSSCNMRIASGNNKLSSLSLSSGTLSPEFNPNTVSYTATVDANNVTVNYETGDSNADVQCDCNNIALNYGLNTVDVKVIAETGALRVYTIRITRPDNRDTNNDLKSLTLSKGTIYFEKNKTDYTVNVDGDVYKLTITAVLDSKKAYFQDYSFHDPKDVSLKYGLNTVKIVVIAENGEKKTYKIDITRKDDRDSNNNLSDLTVTPGNLDFDSKVLEYKVNVNSDVETVKINAKASSKKANVTIDGPDKLVFGANEYKVTVTAENTNKKEYKITVIRNEENTTLSSEALLKNLIIEGYNIDFDSEVFEYEIYSNDKEFTVMTEAKDNISVYVVNDGKVDENGDIIIRVTAEDGTVNKYVVHVNQVVKNKIKITTVIIIILSIFIVGAVIYLVVGNRDGNKKEEPKDNNPEVI